MSELDFSSPRYGRTPKACSDGGVAPVCDGRGGGTQSPDTRRQRRHLAPARVTAKCALSARICAHPDVTPAEMRLQQKGGCSARGARNRENWECLEAAGSARVYQQVWFECLQDAEGGQRRRNRANRVDLEFAVLSCAATIVSPQQCGMRACSNIFRHQLWPQALPIRT